MALDLSIRDRFPGTSLDDVMREVWARFGKAFVPYDVADLEGTLGDVVGDADFAREFFDAFIRGTERDPAVPVPAYERLLPLAGLSLERGEGPWIGNPGLEYGRDGAVVRAPIRIGSPLYDVGIERGDVIVSIGGVPLSDAAAFGRALSRYAPGDRASVVWRSRGDEFEGTLTVASDPKRVRPARRGRRRYSDGRDAGPSGTIGYGPGRPKHPTRDHPPTDPAPGERHNAQRNRGGRQSGHGRVLRDVGGRFHQCIRPVRFQRRQLRTEPSGGGVRGRRRGLPPLLGHPVQIGGPHFGRAVPSAAKSQGRP